ncbi:alpha-hemoglobin-stabilizing protein [Rhynchocyon petersi]
MALQTNKDLISTGMKEFNILLNQQSMPLPPISENDVKKMVDDWVNFYVNYYSHKVTGEQQEQERALQELRLQLNGMAVPFLEKYRDFLKSL